MVRWKVPYTFVKHMDSAFVKTAWDFLIVIYTQNMVPHKILGFFDDYLYYYIFLRAAWYKIWWITYQKHKEFCIGLHKDLSPKGRETLWQSLAPFRIFSGVDSVQRIITGWSRAEIQLNWKKYQTNSEKS